MLSASSPCSKMFSFVMLNMLLFTDTDVVAVKVETGLTIQKFQKIWPGDKPFTLFLQHLSTRKI